MHSSYAFPESFTHDVVVVAEPRSEEEEEEITIFSPSLRKLRDVMLFLLKARNRFKIEQQKSTRANAFTNDTLRFLNCCLFFFLLLEEEDDSNSGASLIMTSIVVVSSSPSSIYLSACVSRRVLSSSSHISCVFFSFLKCACYKTGEKLLSNLFLITPDALRKTAK